MQKLQMIWILAVSEFRIGRRLVRTWLFVALAFVLAGYEFWELTSLHASASLFCASLGMLNPKYELIASSATLLLIFQIGIVLLVFDIRSRDDRARIAEALAARPFSNLELLTGRVLGVTLTMTIPAVILVVSMSLVGVGLQVFEAPFGETMEPFSVLSFLLLDLVPNLTIFGAFTIFLTLTFRSGLLAAAVSIAAAVALFSLKLLVPPDWIPAVANATSAVIFASELAPEFANGWVLSQRLVLILVTLGLLFVCALLYPRLDSVSRNLRGSLGFGCLISAVLIQSVLILQATSARENFDRLAALHESLAYQPRADVEHIQGTLFIDPGNSVDVEYRISFLSPTDGGEELLFAFNDGFEIDSLTVDGKAVSYEFSDGLIRIPFPATGAKEGHVLAIVASGHPSTSFGYLDSALNEYSVTNSQAQSLSVLGVQKAVFHERYVALTPAVKWYPTAGSAYAEDDLERIPRDQFTVDLKVTVPDEWIVAGPGTREQLSNTERTEVRFASQVSLPEVGLFAARFVRQSTTIADVEFELLLSPKHTRNSELFSDAMPVLEQRVEEMFSRARELGIAYPYGMLSLVEVPNVLRVYGGGWRMDTIHALPGVLLIRESGFPTARFDGQISASQADNDGEPPSADFLTSLLETYFENDLSGGSPFITVTRNLVDYQTSPRGKGAIPLRFLVDALVSKLVHSYEGFFSIYYAGDRSNAFTLVRLSRANANWFALAGPLAKSQYEREINTPHVWTKLSNTALTDLKLRDEPREFLETLLLKSNILAELLLDTVGSEKIGEFLGELTNRYRGGTYTKAEILQTATNLDLDLKNDIRDWLNEYKLPGFRAYEPSIERLADEEWGVPVFQTVFYLTNHEPVGGTARFSYRIWGADGTVPDPIETSPVRIDGNSTVRIALKTQNNFRNVQIQTYLSLNQDTFDLDIPTPVSWEPQEQELLPFVTVVDWLPSEDGSVTVDDLDEGFSVTKVANTSRNRMRVPHWRTLNFNWRSRNYFGAFPRIEYDQGLPTSWSSGLFARQSSDFGWGRYRLTTAWAFAQKEGPSAHFSC